MLNRPDLAVSRLAACSVNIVPRKGHSNSALTLWSPQPMARYFSFPMEVDANPIAEFRSTLVIFLIDILIVTMVRLGICLMMYRFSSVYRMSTLVVVSLWDGVWQGRWWLVQAIYAFSYKTMLNVFRVVIIFKVNNQEIKLLRNDKSDVLWKINI